MWKFAGVVTGMLAWAVVIAVGAGLIIGLFLRILRIVAGL